jgi:hypothetical protein
MSIRVSQKECLDWFGYASVEAVPMARFTFPDAPACNSTCRSFVNEIPDKWAFKHNVIFGGADGSASYPLQRFAALIELASYRQYGDFLDVIRKFSDGERLRLLRRAESKGYFIEEFPLDLFAADRHDIHHSKAVRQGRPIDGNLLLDVDALSAAPRQSDCIRYWQRGFGVFRSEPGHRQGDVTVDRRLVAYIVLHRTGSLGSYVWIIGHADHVAEGVMDLCHHHIMRLLLDDRPAWAEGLELIRYAGMEDGSLGLFHWKRRAGFRPYRLFGQMSDGCRTLLVLSGSFS